MKTEEIFALWDKDVKIDITQLHVESLRIPELHNKYYKIYITESRVLRQLKAMAAKLRKDKAEFFLYGPDEETKAKGWELPPRGRVVKPDLESTLAADPDITALNLKIGNQEEKVALIKSILENISHRSFHIGRAIDFIRFQNGT